MSLEISANLDFSGLKKVPPVYLIISQVWLASGVYSKGLIDFRSSKHLHAVAAFMCKTT